MTLALAGGILAQIAAIVLLRIRLGARWLRHPAVLLVLTSAVYQGLAPLLLSIPSVAAWDTFREGIAPGYIGSAVFLLSVAMLVFTVGYLAAHPERTPDVAPRPSGMTIIRALDWRILSVACLPLAVLTYEGRGYNGANSIGAGASLAESLASTFFTLLVVLAAFALVMRHGPRWFFVTLIAQSTLLGAAGERLPVVADAVILILMLSHVGMRPPLRQLQAAAALTMLGVLAITSVRAEQGRSLFARDSGLSSRLAALGQGLTPGALYGTPSGTTPGLVAQGAARLDGTSFTAGILQAQHIGQPRLGASYVPESLLVGVPHFAWSAKLARGNALNPVALEIASFGLKSVNFLPGLPGLYAGFLPPAWLALLMGALGLLAGWGERWLLRECTPARLVLLAGAATTALWFEKGLPDMLLALRAAIVVALVVKLMEGLRARRRGGTSTPYRERLAPVR